ncbi:MAG: hypothetical protein U0795_23315 [Pirellulales bacterium]
MNEPRRGNLTILALLIDIGVIAVILGYVRFHQYLDYVRPDIGWDYLERTQAAYFSLAFGSVINLLVRWSARTAGIEPPWRYLLAIYVLAVLLVGLAWLIAPEVNA